MSFNTFDEVVARYAQTPVIRSTWGMTYDIRPVGGRGRPAERIIKISEDCYVLSDGWHGGAQDVMRARYSSSLPGKLDVQKLLLHAPIIWRCSADGVDTLEVRNCGYNSNSPHTRHRFLTRYLPHEMTVNNYRAGIHTLQILQGGEHRDVYLPKVTQGKNESFTFLRGPDGRWVLPKNARPVPVRRVDKVRKASYVAAIKVFHAWAKLMLPMLPIDNNVALAEAKSRLWDTTRDTPDAALVMTILADPEHPLRVDLAMALYAETTRNDERRSRMIPQTLMRPLNRWCGWDTVQERSFRV